jgi:hypothetical protein
MPSRLSSRPITKEASDSVRVERRRGCALCHADMRCSPQTAWGHACAHALTVVDAAPGTVAQTPSGSLDSRQSLRSSTLTRDDTQLVPAKKQDILVGSGLPAYAANPSFAGLLDDLDIRVTRIREEFAMLIHAQEFHAR